MYHFIVRKIIIRAFNDMSEGNYEAVLKGLAELGVDEAIAAPITD